MKNKAMMVVLVAVAVLFAGGAQAWWGGYDPGDGPGKAIDVESFKKFQKETSGLRDEMMVRKIELRNEYSKDTPDMNRIATIRKELVDLETKLQAAADKYGIDSTGPGRGHRGHGMMGRGMMSGGPGGCQCQMCGW